MTDLRSLFLRPDAGSAPPATLALRIAVGGVFLTSGVLKFLYANQGVGRFTRIGLPDPEHLAPFVGSVEVIAGALVLVGLVTRLAALPLIVDMLVAIAVTKLPLLVGHGPEPVSADPKTGLLAFAYQARLDLTMLLACVFLVAAGAGALSLDARRARGLVAGG